VVRPDQDPIQWGTTRPTKPMTPLTETATAARSVAVARKILLTLATGQPNDWAVSSPRDRRFMSLASHCETARPMRR